MLQRFKIVLKLRNGMEVSDIKLDLLINTVGLLPEFQQCPMLTTTKNVNDLQNKVNL